MRLLTHILVRRHTIAFSYKLRLSFLRRFTSNTASHSSSCIDRTLGIPVGNSGHVLLSVTESSAFPKKAYPNVIVYLPPGPIFQPSGGHDNENGKGAVVHPREINGEAHPYSSLTRNSVDYFRTQHHLAEETVSTVVTIHYRLGTLEPPDEEEEERGLVNEGEIINPTSQFKKGPRLVHYKYPIPIHDTLVAFDWIQETFQPSQTSIIGTHIGGSIALMLALTESESIHAVAALEPICDWTGLDAYCAIPEEEQDQDQGQDLGQEQKEPETESPETSSKSRGIKKKKRQSPGPPDLAPLLQARESLFSKPSQYFDTFASPLLFLRSPGKPVPARFPKYLTGPEYPIPVLKPRPVPVPRDDDILDLWDAVSIPDTEQWVDDDGAVHGDPSDSGDGDSSSSSGSPTPSTTSTTPTVETYTPRYRRSLSRWPPHGLDWGLSGTTWFRSRFHRLQRPQVTLPWVRICIRGNGNSDNSITTNNEDAPPKSKKDSPKKKPKNEGTVISHQATDMVDVVRRACFWGRERGVSERGVVLERVGDGEGDDAMWYVTAEEEAGRWLFEVRGEPR